MNEHTKQQAMQYLDDMRDSDPHMKRDNAIDSVVLTYGCTVDEAIEVYDEWERVTA